MSALEIGEVCGSNGGVNDPPPQDARPKWARAIRIVRARPRLFLSVLIGLIVVAALPGDWSLTTRLIIGWDVAVGLYLAAVFQFMARADVHYIRRHALEQDEGRIAVLVLTIVAAIASLAAILVELGSHPGVVREPVRLLLAMITIVLSWSFIHTIFALHYAHEYYAEHRGGGGLAFPGDEPPDYRDFVYFSFGIGMTSQVSDVQVTSKAVRRMVTAHSIISFAFNVALLALMVNIAASAI